jgi:hypothetical protein
MEPIFHLGNSVKTVMYQRIQRLCER